MVLPPNRVGGTRGPNGTTLDDLLEALTLLRTAVIGQGAVLGSLLTELQNQGEAQGSPGLTDCNLSQIELLCSINTVLSGEGALGGPPASCEGFPENPTAWLNVVTWVPGQGPSGPADDWRGEFSTGAAPNGLYIDVLQPYGSNPEISFQVLRCTLNATNVCVSWSDHDQGTGVIVDYWDYNTNAVVISTTLDSNSPHPVVGSHAFNFDADQGLLFSVNTAGSTELPPPPTVKLWIVKGAQG